MKGRLPALTVLLFIGVTTNAQQAVERKHILPTFLGRNVTVTGLETNADGPPKGPASMCIEGPPQRQCYTAPEAFEYRPTATPIQLQKDTPALLFSAESYGVSGWQIHFGLLRPGDGKDLDDLFLSSVTVSNQSQYTFWSDSSISDSRIFLTADYEWGPGESHYDHHRYIVSVYVRKASDLLADSDYYLEDRYMTVRKYDLENQDILASEKQEILARLRRVKAVESPGRARR